jgi:hypothetical protein
MIRSMTALLCLISVASLYAENLVLESGPEKVSVIELFGSEGCSSCPPADAWLNQLKNHPGLWKDFVAMSFHVDYWDYLGWKDPFSSAHSTQHQQEYTHLWNSNTLYTPCMILNGSQWRNWADGGIPPKKSDEAVGILKAVRASESRWEITFKPASKSNETYEVHLSYLGMGIKVEVKAGENRGRTLQHEFVVLNHERVLMQRDENRYSSILETSIDSKNQAGSLAVVVWISERNNPQPLQAAGGLIPS